MFYLAKIEENNSIADFIVVSKSTKEESESWASRALGGSWMVVADENKNPIFNVVPAIGFTWKPEAQGFIAPKPYDSWVLGEDELSWLAPVSKPEDEKIYIWDEEVTNWVAVESVAE